MDPLIVVLLIIVAGGAFVPLLFWLERRLRQPGLAFFLIATAMLVSAAFGFVAGRRLLPVLFSLQGIGFLYTARWRRNEARADRGGEFLKD